MSSALFERVAGRGVTFACVLLPALAAAESAALLETLDTLEREIDWLEQEYAARHAALDAEMKKRLSALEAQMAALKTMSTQEPATLREPRTPGGKLVRQPALDVSGDFRLRCGHTTRHAGDPARDRGVLRARLGGSYAVNERFTVGGRLTTGDPDDPNSVDVTLDDFVDDLTVSLDQAYAHYRLEDFEIVGGKFANLSSHTELVWDGDVNPYGLAGRYTFHQGAATAVRVTGMYSIVDEQIAAQSSNMLGAQASFDLLPAADWQFGLDAAYYNYEIGSLLGADPGDTRDNNLAPGGSAYLSDFDLLDFVVRIGYSGLGDGWPLQMVGDYVRNLGAAVPEDSGWSLKFSLGELAAVGDWRAGYGYAVAETDAVLASFSQDNTTYATNFREHAVTVDYMPFDDAFLNLTGYLYRRDNFSLANQPGEDHWVSRLRLNLLFQF